MYLQTDKRWAEKFLDSVPYKIGRWGCTVTSLANGRESIGLPAMSPKLTSDKLSFTPDGYLIWSSTEKVGVKMVHYVRFWDKTRGIKALKSKDEFCLVELDGWHWALLWGTTLGVRIYDPLYGVRFLSPKYKQITKTVILKKI